MYEVGRYARVEKEHWFVCMQEVMTNVLSNKIDNNMIVAIEIEEEHGN